MANLRETSTWEAGIYQLETSDPVMGGENGIDNRAPRQLANRTLWLKNELTKQIGLVNQANTNLGNQKADKTTQFTAGNGLTGGGDLSASRTLALGTPSKITATTTNVATSNTHSHEIDKASTTAAGIVQLNNTLTSTAANQALTAAQGKILNDSKLANTGVPTLNGTLAIQNNEWRKLDMYGADGVLWRMELNPAYKTAANGAIGMRFLLLDGHNRQCEYDFPKSSGNEKIAYQSWVNQQTAQINSKMVAKATGVNLDSQTNPCFFTHQGLTAKRLPVIASNDFAGLVIGHEADCTQLIAESGNLFVRGSDANPITQETDWTDWREILRNDTGVTLTGNQTITGVKTFASNVTVRGVGASNLTLGSGADDVFIQNTRANKFLQLKDNGVLSYSEQKIYHEGHKPKWREIEQIPNLITNPTQITSGDLNTYTAEGFYFCNANVHATAIKNTPINRAFSLQVLKTAGVVQILNEYQSSNVYVRAFYNGNWTAWTRLATINEVNSKLDKSGGVLTGHLQLNYQNEWVGYSANNPTEGKNGYYDVAVNGIARGGMQVIGRGGGRYDTIIGITPQGATNSDRRVGGLTVSQDGLHSSAYGHLHEYFVKTRDNQTIDGVKTFNKEIVIGSSNGWGRMTMPLTDGTNWVLETNPQYKSNPIGHPVLRFNHNDGGTRRFYDLVKSDKNETIAYQSWVENKVGKALPVGTVVAFARGINRQNGFLLCDGTNFNQNTYPDLYTALGNKNTLPKLNKTDVGQLSYFPSDNIPEDWLECNGQMVSQTVYPELFAYLGNKYGASGKLPDAEDRFIRSAGGGLTVGSKQTGTLGSIDGHPDWNSAGIAYDAAALSAEEVASLIGADPIAPNYTDYNFVQAQASGHSKGIYTVWSAIGNGWSHVLPDGKSARNSHGEVITYIHRPKSIVFKLCIKAKNTLDDVRFWIKAFGRVENEGRLDASHLAHDLRVHTHKAAQISDFAAAIKALTRRENKTGMLIPTHNSFKTQKVTTSGMLEIYPDGRIVQRFTFVCPVIYFHRHNLQAFYRSVLGISNFNAPDDSPHLEIPLWTAMPNKVLEARIHLSSGNIHHAFGEANEWAYDWDGIFNQHKEIKDKAYFSFRRWAGSTDEAVTFNIVVEGY